MRKFLLMVAASLLVFVSAFTSPASSQEGTGTVTVVHGIPGLVVDVYVNAKLTLEDFAPDTVTAPLALPAGTYQLAIRPANAAADSAPVLAGAATLAAGADVSVVAHLDANGQPKLTLYVNDTSPTAAGTARLVVRHTAAAPAVDVLANGQPAFKNLTNPNEAKADLPAGTISAAVAAAGTTTPVLGPTNLTLADGTETIVYAVGSLQGGSLHVLTQTVPLQAAAPPTTSAPATDAPVAPAPPSGGGELPETGSSDTTVLLVAVGLGALVLGVLLTKRSALH